MNIKKIAIVQARLSSKRLPNKVLLPIGKNSSIGMVLGRLKTCRNIDDIIVATTKQKVDDLLCQFCEENQIKFFRGSTKDVLSRFYGAAKYLKAQVIVRVTSDTPLIDPNLIDEGLEIFSSGRYDYYSNVIKRTFPDGLDFEIFDFKTLELTHKHCKSSWGREHVTVYMRTGSNLPTEKGHFKVGHFITKQNFSHLRWTLDTYEDLEFFRALSVHGVEKKSWLDIISVITKNPNLLMWNRNHLRRKIAGSKVELKQNNIFEKSIKQLNKSLKVIPVGSQTFSKSYMGWVLGKSPLYAKSGHGSEITDIDGNVFIDYVMSLMPIVLGYSDPFVDSAVVRQLKSGTILSLPGVLEEKLSNILVNLIPSAEMVRFGKNGSDVTTAAVRLARAYTGKDKVIICGYHGWHDWYIGTTEKKLGVPKNISSLSSTFFFNDIMSLKKLLSSKKNDYACLIIEPSGKVSPKKGFLGEVRKLCNKYGIILIFDEVISGFRINLGGAQKEYNVTPDLSCFGKAMANGYPISALVGKKNIMTEMDKIFFSTTFGGDLTSLSAAIATIQKLKETGAIERIKITGNILKKEINKIIVEENLQDFFKFSGEDWWPRIDFFQGPFKKNLLLALLRQEFCKNGLLIASGLNLSFSHTNYEIIEQTIKKVKQSLNSVSRILRTGNFENYIGGEVVFDDFSVRAKLKNFKK